MVRYSSFSKGLFTEKGRKGRKTIVIDVRKTDTAKLADSYVEIEQVSDLLPSYNEEGTEEVEGVTYRKFTGDVNVGGKGLLLISRLI